MLEELLKKCFDEEPTADKSAGNIKTAVLSRIEEDKPMKHFNIKPLLIAAAVAVTGAASLVTANAATDGAVMDGIAKTFSFIVNGQEVQGTITEYEVGDGGKAERIEFDLPEDAVPEGYGIVIEADGGEGFKIIGEDGVIYSTDGDNV